VVYPIMAIGHSPEPVTTFLDLIFHCVTVTNYTMYWVKLKPVVVFSII